MPFRRHVASRLAARAGESGAAVAGAAVATHRRIGGSLGSRSKPQCRGGLVQIWICGGAPYPARGTGDDGAVTHPTYSIGYRRALMWPPNAVSACHPLR